MRNRLSNVSARMFSVAVYIIAQNWAQTPNPTESVGSVNYSANNHSSNCLAAIKFMLQENT